MKKSVTQKKDQTANGLNHADHIPQVAGVLHPDTMQQKQVSAIKTSRLIALQRKKLNHMFGHSIQLVSKEDEEEPKQSKSIAQRAENKTGMSDNLKSGIEQLSGLDMSDVRVQYNSAKPASVQAHAYTQGTNIHIAPGQERHLPHEAWHVAQQKQGRVQPTTSVNGMAVNDSPALEKEADAMGARASLF